MDTAANEGSRVHANSLVRQGRMIIVRSSMPLQYLCVTATREAMSFGEGIHDTARTKATRSTITRARGGSALCLNKHTLNSFSRRGGDDRPSPADSKRIANEPTVEATIVGVFILFFSAAKALEPLRRHAT